MGNFIKTELWTVSPCLRTGHSPSEHSAQPTTLISTIEVSLMLGTAGHCKTDSMSLSRDQTRDK